jgi:hypothetical protein
MKTWERRVFNALTLVVSATGFAWLWMKYFVVSDDPFAVVNHPWQPAMQAVHVVASPALLLMFGLILNSHIMKKLGARNVPNRKSGLVSLGAFFAMTATGYLLQVVTHEAALQALVILHVGSATLFALLYGAHLVVSVRLARSQAARRLQAEPV